MREKYYTAAEAAKVLRLEYHAFMWRVRKKRMYPQHERIGQVYLFDKTAIDAMVKNNEDKKNAFDRGAMEKATRKILLR